MLTFLIGTRQRWQFLDTLLGALETQTRKDFRIIVCDEGEEMPHQLDTTRVLDHHPTLDIRRFVQPWAQDWHYTAKNKAFEMVDTEWVGFPQDDWYYVPSYVQKMLNVPPNAQLVATDWLHTQANGKLVYQPVFPSIGLCSIGNFIIRASLFDEVGRFAEIDAVADGRMIVKANEKSPMIRIQEPLAVGN